MITPEQFNETVSSVATDYVRHLGSTLLNWKGVEVKVVFDPSMKAHAYYKGGPVVIAVISFGPNEKDFRRMLYDVAKAAARLWNPVEESFGYKMVKSKGDKVKSKSGDMEILVPMKYCQVSKSHSITIKGPDNVSITIDDPTGRRLESEMLFEARVKLSRLIHWDNENE